jgi:hypothetical protein
MPAFVVYDKGTQTTEILCSEPGCENWFNGGFIPGAEDQQLMIDIEAHDSWHGFDGRDTDDVYEGPTDPACDFCNDEGSYTCGRCGGQGIDDYGDGCLACEGNGWISCVCQED